MDRKNIIVECIFLAEAPAKYKNTLNSGKKAGNTLTMRIPFASSIFKLGVWFVKSP